MTPRQHRRLQKRADDVVLSLSHNYAQTSAGLLGLIQGIQSLDHVRGKAREVVPDLAEPDPNGELCRILIEAAERLAGEAERLQRTKIEITECNGG